MNDQNTAKKSKTIKLSLYLKPLDMKPLLPHLILLVANATLEIRSIVKWPLWDKNQQKK